ncbi:ABC transporter permease [Gloeobacter violaceus]|uniref:Gll0345 protein n=1 Tax=Gloeobacter violaceus (strain ATCC 29082 / PCC 7421) TaxID=251221 RepID=Q7NNR5_GLOVI|nr:ABC transporter permease [Gloeobacter violaceus]BAC88286.1 gll0345 [Gloeobacter violaceus PCC 7421]
MLLIESLRMAVATLGANKLRSGLTMLGIVIGNASVIAMVGIGQGSQNFIAGKLEAYGTNRITVFTQSEDPDGYVFPDSKLVLSDAEAVRTQVPAVRAVAPIIEVRLPIFLGSRRTATNVRGTTPDFARVQNFAVERGRLFSPDELQRESQVVILGATTANKLFGRAAPIGREVTINNLPFRVVGLLKPKGSFAGDNPDETAVVPVTTMANRVVGRRSAYGTPITYLEAMAVDSTQIRSAGFQMLNVLERLHGRKDIILSANKSFIDLANQVSGALSLLLSLVAAVSLLVGGIGIMNMMLVSVGERTQEIGLRKAIGAKQRDILSQFLFEAVLLSAAGGLAGIAVGIGATLPLAWFTPIRPLIPWSAVLLAVGVSGTIGLVFGVFPARQAARLDPIAALRSS